MKDYVLFENGTKTDVVVKMNQRDAEERNLNLKKIKDLGEWKPAE